MKQAIRDILLLFQRNEKLFTHLLSVILVMSVFILKL